MNENMAAVWTIGNFDGTETLAIGTLPEIRDAYPPRTVRFYRCEYVTT